MILLSLAFRENDAGADSQNAERLLLRSSRPQHTWLYEILLAAAPPLEINLVANRAGELFYGLVLDVGGLSDLWEWRGCLLRFWLWRGRIFLAWLIYISTRFWPRQWLRQWLLDLHEFTVNYRARVFRRAPDHRFVEILAECNVKMKWIFVFRCLSAL